MSQDDKFQIVKCALPIKAKVYEQSLPRPAVGYKVGAELRMTADKGIGVFATEFIPAGTQIYDFDMYEFDQSEFLELVEMLPLVEDRKFLLDHCWGGPNDNIMMTTSDIIFTNHSQEPTILYSLNDCLGNAARDIHPGEELTEDYRLYEGPQYLKDLRVEYGLEYWKFL